MENEEVSQGRISNFKWTFEEGQEEKMAELAIMFNAPNCIVKIGQTMSGSLLLNVIVVSA